MNKKQRQVPCVTKKEIAFLAEAYVRLKHNRTFKQCSAQFRDFVNEYLNEELQAYLGDENGKHINRK